tara:strand:+ start:205 stop:312 length:108 start_codon:yes stop_codon:yes gene_type:complete
MHAGDADVQRDLDTFWNTVALLIIEHMGPAADAAK